MRVKPCPAHFSCPECAIRMSHLDILSDLLEESADIIKIPTIRRDILQALNAVQSLR